MKRTSRYFNYKDESYKISDTLLFLDEGFQEPGELRDHLERLRKDGNDILFDNILPRLEFLLERAQDQSSSEDSTERAKIALQTLSNVRYYSVNNDNATEAATNMFYVMVEILSLDNGIVFEGLSRILGRQRGGKASKKSLVGIKWLIKTVLDERGHNLTWRNVWKIIEKKHTSETPFMAQAGEASYEIYFDGDRIFQVDDKTGHSGSIGEETFRKYLSEIKKLKKMEIV